MWRVSSVLELNGLSQPHAVMKPMYRIRGKAIHSAAEAIAEGYEPVLDSEYQGYAEALKIWFRKFSPTVVSIEVRIVNRNLALTGRIDLVVIIDGRVWIVDIKTGSPAVHYRWQTAMYAMLACDDVALWARIAEAAGVSLEAQRHEHLIGRAVLYLSNSVGRPKWVPFVDPQDLYIARSALALVRLRHQHGLLHYTDPEQPDDDAETGTDAVAAEA